MHPARKNPSYKTSKLKEGALVRVYDSQDIRLRSENPEYGHLEDVSTDGDPVVGVITKLWPNGYRVREFEMLSSGIFFILSSNNGFEVDEVEVLS